MVDLSGHVAFGLLFGLPAWFLWEGRVSVAFLALAVVGSLLPDVDIWLVALFPNVIHHHGITHTVLFVVVASAAGGVLFATVFGSRIDRWTSSHRVDRSGLVWFTTAGFLVGSLSHLFADILSAPDVSTPIEPFWPVVREPLGIDLVWYNAFWINAGFLTVVLAIHLVLAYLTTSVDRRRRLFPN